LNIHLYLSFILASAIVLIIPGPTILTVISQSIHHGRKSAFPLVLGVLLGDFSAMTLSLLGLGAILQTSAVLFRICKLVGASYLVYLGLKSCFVKDIQNTPENGTEEKKSRSQLFRSTFLVTILNPKSIAFFVAFFPQFVDPAGIAVHQFFLLGTTFLVLAAVNSALYAVFSGNLGHFMKRDIVKKWFQRISGGVLIGAGLMTLAVKEQ